MDRQFRGIWIPAEVWLDERLTALEKIILCEIDSLCDEEKGCYASNEYLAEFCQCSTSKITKAICNLKQYGYIIVSCFDGRKRTIRTVYNIKNNIELLKNANLESEKVRGRLVKSTRQTSKKYEADSQNLLYINIDNNIDYNKENNIKENDVSHHDVSKKIIDYLNEKTNKHFKYTKNNLNKIETRLKEGFNYEDFVTVIDKKSDEWLQNDEMNCYLRPDTLFGTKFESYLNQKKIKKKFSIDDWINEGD